MLRTFLSAKVLTKGIDICWLKDTTLAELFKQESAFPSKTKYWVNCQVVTVRFLPKYDNYALKVYEKEYTRMPGIKKVLCKCQQIHGINYA